MIPPRVKAMFDVAACSMRVCAPTLFESLTGAVRRDVCDARIAWWARRMVEIADARVEVVGAEHLAGPPSVVMSNHQSHYDVPVLYTVLPGSVRMVAKRELFQIPVFGGALRAADFVEVDRGNRPQAIESLRRARALLASGVSVWIAPEGTRSVDGRLGSFKKGGFVLAEEAGVPILPVSVEGTIRVLPAHSTALHGGETVRVTVHPRVQRGDVATREDWIAAVRARIASGLAAP